MICTICNGCLTYLGQLGDTHHGRCRDCGMVQTIAPEGDNEE